MNENLKILKTAEEIENRVREIGAELKSLIKDSQPVAVCVLSGSFIFYSDLIRTLNTDMTCEFLGVSSYKNNVVSGGEVALTLDLANPIEGKEVILIEDLVDTGLTMEYLSGLILARKPKRLIKVSLLFKPASLKVSCKMDIVGFEIGPEFVVGYGIDHAGEYRNLPYLALLKN